MTATIGIVLLRNIFIKLILVFGVVFVDYLLLLTLDEGLKKSRWHKYQRLISRAALALTLVIDMIILQSALLLISFDTVYQNTVIWRNLDLQLMVLFYFLYISREKIMIPINGLAAIAALIYYNSIYGGKMYFIHEYVKVALAVIALVFLSYLINKHNRQWIKKINTYLLTEVGFAVAWGAIVHELFNVTLFSFFEFVVNFVGMMFIVHLMNMLVRKHRDSFLDIVSQANTDKLTRIGNRNAFDKEFNRLFEMYRQSRHNLTFVMLDIDHFKQFNDQHGHLLGDEVLQALAKIAQQELDKLPYRGRVYRTGGEEFGILLREYSGSEVNQIMSDICQKINQYPIVSGGEELHISVSAGISSLRTADYTTKYLYKRVDRYLYQSKEKGRHLITSEGQPIVY
jgi:diguanylate cyclase (GGDEF)-like protein